MRLKECDLFFFTCALSDSSSLFNNSGYSITKLLDVRERYIFRDGLPRSRFAGSMPSQCAFAGLNGFSTTPKEQGEDQPGYIAFAISRSKRGVSPLRKEGKKYSSAAWDFSSDSTAASALLFSLLSSLFVCCRC